MATVPTVRPAKRAEGRSVAGRGMGPPRSTRRAHAQPQAFIQLFDLVITGLALLTVVSMFTISPAMLARVKIHYMTVGGSFYEKIHPATYLAVPTFCLLLIRNADPIGDIVRIFSEAKLLLFYLLCWVVLLVQVVVTGHPFTLIVDAFLLPLLLFVLIWQLSPGQRRPLVWAIHLTMLINIAIGYYEYKSGHRLFPLALGTMIVQNEWRASALLGHPLTASGAVAAYSLALIFRPALCPPLFLRLPLIGLSLGSLMAFGGRTSLVTTVFVIGCAVAFQALRLLRGGRMSPLVVAATICLAFVGAACIFTAFDLGFFDKMLLRFSSDKGSAHARLATFSLLSRFDWYELLLGPDPVRGSSIQTSSGLKFGIEDFWVSCIVQFGIASTIMLTAAMAGLFTEILKRASGAAWTILILMFTIAVSSVSFSSKNIQLAQFIVLIMLLLPREHVTHLVRSPETRAGPRPYPAFT